MLYGGSVDLRRLQRPPAAIARDIQRLLDDTARQAPRARVLILGILPEREMPSAMGARIEAANEALAALAGSRPLVSFVETSRPPLVQAPSGSLVPGMSMDRLHLNEAGYKEVASWILDADEDLASLLQP